MVELDLKRSTTGRAGPKTEHHRSRVDKQEQPLVAKVDTFVFLAIGLSVDMPSSYSQLLGESKHTIGNQHLQEIAFRIGRTIQQIRKRGGRAGPKT